MATDISKICRPPPMFVNVGPGQLRIDTDYAGYITTSYITNEQARMGYGGMPPTDNNKPWPGLTQQEVDELLAAMNQVAVVEHANIDLEPASCPHQWKEYLGLTQRYDYCTICGEKRNS